MASHSTPFHLFAFGGGRPFANKKMRQIFGPLCDSPSPKEYIDPSSGEEIIAAVVDSMRNASDFSGFIKCRAVRGQKPQEFMMIKHLRSFKNPGQVKYRCAHVMHQSPLYTHFLL